MKRKAAKSLDFRIVQRRPRIFRALFMYNFERLRRIRISLRYIISLYTSEKNVQLTFADRNPSTAIRIQITRRTYACVHPGTRERFAKIVESQRIIRINDFLHDARPFYFPTERQKNVRHLNARAVFRFPGISFPCRFHGN